MQENVMSVRAVPEPVTRQDAATHPPAAVISPDLPAPIAPLLPGQSVDQRLTDLIARHARCADSGLDPDEWFPVSPDPAKARLQAAAAIAVCAGCPVRGQCLELSLRHWNIGQHGIWGGLLATDRARLHTWLPASRTTGPATQPAATTRPPQHTSSGTR
jgi:WhiB family redox-sensing transcriptional regulator